jgi:phosphatidylinositol alpha-mannosyltransferase
VRIGIVTQSYYPRYGGVTEHVHSKAVELRRRGHDVTVITSHFRRGENGTAAGVERVGYNILIPFNGAFVDLAVGMRLRGQLRKLLAHYDFDVVHTHAPLVPTLPMMAVLEATCPQVGTFHMTGNPNRFLNWLARMQRPVMDRLDERIAVSITARQYAAQMFPGHYHVIPNGVDVSRFHPGVAPFAEWRDSEFVNLLFVGRLDPRKGVHLLLAAMPEILERTKRRARLLVVGDSYLRPKFEASVPAWVRPHVRFLGHVPSADLPRWYATGDIFVSPASGQESFGIVLVEAMAAARAVVASDIAGYRTVVDPDENGVVFEPGNVKALARAVSGLVNDPERRLLLGGRGRRRALEFAWPTIAARIESIYVDILRRHGRVVPQPQPVPDGVPAAAGARGPERKTAAPTSTAA